MQRFSMQRFSMRRLSLHVEPLTDEQLNQQISDTMPRALQAFPRARTAHRDRVSGMNGQRRHRPASSSMPRWTMKELGQRMACDPFLRHLDRGPPWRRHGLGPAGNPRYGNRRSKNIVLTPEGEAVRERLHRRDLVPGAVVHRAFDTGERPVPARADAEDAPIARRGGEACHKCRRLVRPLAIRSD